MPGRFIATLGNHVVLSDEERQLLTELVGPRRVYGAGAEIFEEGETSTDCRVLLQGQAFRHKTLADGRRQIMCFHVAGDMVDLQRVFLGLDYAVTALTLCDVALVPRGAMAAMMATQPRIAHAMWRLSLTEGAVFREWMVGMGRRTAYARIAHLLCEVAVRMRTAGLMEGARCRFPATQTHLADSLGLSVVHTNRVLQALRREKLVEIRGRELMILDWAGLQAAGEFDPAYLQLGGKAA